jgi:hypothetical protein
MCKRDDIYLCYCCYQFSDTKTDKMVDVHYIEMPAELAMELMINRAIYSSKSGKKKHRV